MDMCIARAFAVFCRIAYRLVAEGLKCGVNVIYTMKTGGTDKTYTTFGRRPSSDISLVGGDWMRSGKEQRSQSCKYLGVPRHDIQFRPQVAPQNKISA